MADNASRNFGSISPSANSLLILKGFTNIPFAAAAANLLGAQRTPKTNLTVRDAAFWFRVLHFESRYWSIDQLLEGLDINHFLEISSGYSFRGLEIVSRKNIHYIDTDLENIIDYKLKMLAQLKTRSLYAGQLETLPLTALEEKAFQKMIDRFDDGPVIILNEGLLMYLSVPEKKKLAGIIRRILEKRGGYWITADIYLRKENHSRFINSTELEKKFYAEHKIEENKFSSFEEAQDFFTEAGFVIDAKYQPDTSKLSSLQYFLNLADYPMNETEIVERITRADRSHDTWRLKTK